MKLAAYHFLHNLKLKYKLFFIIAILFFFIVDLGALNVTSIFDIQKDTRRLSENLIPRLLQTTAIKDNLNLSILAATDYVNSGNPTSKKQFEEYLQAAITAEVQLFLAATSEADLEFTSLFQEQINVLNDELRSLIDLYDAEASQEAIQDQIVIVSAQRNLFATFLADNIEGAVQREAEQEREATAQQVQQTIINISIVALLTILALTFLFIFVRRSFTTPLEQLTAAAESLGKGQFQVVNIDSKDELGLFAETFNTMLHNIRTTQEALQYELEKTKKLDRQKTEFLSIAAHQLRTPMSGIKWLINMTVDGDLGRVSKEAKDQLGKGLENVNRMITLINSLLDVSQIEMQQLEYAIAPHDIAEIIYSVVYEFTHLADIAQVRLSVEEPATALSPALVDAEKISMAFRNLIDNAIKYTPKKGAVKIRFAQSKHTVDVSIQDTGYGIPEDEYERIYTKFYRGSNIQTIQADGSGLGLFVVKQIVDQHNGDIEFESVVDTGTTFTVSLPIAQ